MKAVIFDFNGTLYFDHQINKEAWKQCLAELTDNKLDFEPFYQRYKAVRNAIVIKDCCKEFNIKADNDFCDKWATHKEDFYQKIALEVGTSLAPGAKEFMDYLKNKDIKMNLCTSSVESNIEFYYKNFDLDNWFKRELIVYDSGEYQNKIEMYKDAAKHLDVDIKDCVIIEDTGKSINEAILAGAKKIIYMNSSNVKLDIPEIIQTVNDFNEIDLSIFA